MAELRACTLLLMASLSSTWLQQSSVRTEQSRTLSIVSPVATVLTCLTTDTWSPPAQATRLSFRGRLTPTTYDSQPAKGQKRISLLTSGDSAWDPAVHACMRYIDCTCGTSIVKRGTHSVWRVSFWIFHVLHCPVQETCVSHVLAEAAATVACKSTSWIRLILVTFPEMLSPNMIHMPLICWVGMKRLLFKPRKLRCSLTSRPGLK